MAKLKTLSIIMPVFNEAATFEETLKQVMKQKVPLKKEIIIVESNSTDGTRKLAKKYVVGKPKRGKIKSDDTPLTIFEGKKFPGGKIKVILEPAPRGKGHALKAGFQEATGDIILIQDGDTEYKTSEYPKLVNPIMQGKTAFVLGSRHAHGSTWKIRKMNTSFYATLINIGHWFFTTLFNITYGVQLTDPATMFKVFRRDAAEGIHWQGNWFELDWEIVGKLIRSGHKPVEIPVSYESRTTEEGKKIRFFRDSTLVLFAILKNKFCEL